MSEATMVEHLPARGMITLRGDFADAGFQNAATSLTGAAFPGRRQIAFDGDRGLAWMSPDELLILLPAGPVADALSRLDQDLAGTHHLATDVTDARATFRIRGPHAREVIAKGAPVDVHPDSFGEGEIRRTRLGQVAAAFWLAGKDDIHLVCFRSVAGFVEEWLCHAARPGAEPEFF